MVQYVHPFDMPLKGEGVNFLIEELPQSTQFASDCMSSASSLASAGTLAGCFSSIGSFSSMGSVTSCG